MTVAITYLGGPTVVLEYAGLTIVTDPTFDAPQSYGDPDDGPPLVKTAGPGIQRSDLPPVDLVLLSHHEHEDNLDYEGLELLATGVRTYSTMKAAGDLFGGGVAGLDPWESDEVRGVTVTAVPALHGPPGSERQLGPVIGFVLESAGEPTVYVSGDNASIPLVEQIAERFPSIGVAVLFAGAAQYGDLPGPLTLSSVDAVHAAEILGAPIVVGVHTEDWEHFSETRADLEAAFGGAPLVATPRGVRVELPAL